MSTSNTIVDEKYKEAIQSLKKINNLLFYDELKNLLNEREQTIAEMNEEVYRSVEKMQKSLKRVPMHISQQLHEEIITPQTELFESGMKQFNENIVIMEKKLSLWHQQYQEYITMTEILLADLKELQRNDYKFIDLQTEKVLEEIQSSQKQIHVLLTKEMNEQASITNLKYESLSERVAVIINNLSSVEANLLAETEQWKKQFWQNQSVLQEKWDEKWELHVDAAAKKEGLIKKWLIALAVGQGVSILLFLLFLFLK
ncbi:hypothetical protein [Neobacillus kokaensis]|uniref:Uncharacterized protein n=1 Tax=Neobacillus kokaensis TaxID=2759023 RepID=A0ABQ3NA42_9BACI|nr:hypothetical protein [Neobacillus kokaensis]GHH99820.1 hypothetical protein AM1BK_33630 [Neobacillus kokaensis]